VPIVIGDEGLARCAPLAFISEWAFCYSCCNARQTKIFHVQGRCKTRVKKTSLFVRRQTPALSNSFEVWS
jgi:hypothetical protein